MQRFYGGSVDWLNIPYKIVNAYAAMMPVLEAEEQLSRITAIGMGTGSMKKEDAGSIMRQLKEQAESRKHGRELSTTAKLISLSGMGIQVVDLRKKKT